MSVLPVQSPTIQLKNESVIGPGGAIASAVGMGLISFWENPESVNRMLIQKNRNRCFIAELLEGVGLKE